MKFLRPLARLARYVYSFGPLIGARNYCAATLPGQFRAVAIPGYSAPIWLRPRTSDSLVLEQVFLHNEYAFQLAHQSPEVIVDAGANVGFASIWLARRYPRARILAIEPEPENFRLLLRNTAPFPQIEARRAALWPSNESISLSNPSGEPWTFQVGESDGESESLPVLTMADVIAWAGTRIGLLKLDIEGAEKELFAAPDRSWTDLIDAIAVEPHDRFKSGCSQAIYRAIESWNFDQEIRGENLMIVRRYEK